MSVNYRERLANIMAATLADNAAHHDWHYHAVRPMYVPHNWSVGQVVVGDCSKGVQYLARWAGVPHDPMGEKWGPYGNSQTLWLRLPHLLQASELKTGDIVTFGHNGDKHAAMVLEPGHDPLLWSFGHEGAPNTYRLSQDGRERQFLRLVLPEYVPPAEEALRAKTGWFAWVAWRLGEGDWRKYGKANATVRPNVPRVIPPTWWARLVVFLRNREKALQ